jgi:signal transduction histidine kinase
MISVSDDGVGMEPHVLERVFDPFFTTKPLGQGTGLGLSMVYGFAKQSGGQVRIESQPGKGTTVRMYLPSADRQSIAAVEQDDAFDMAGDGQTVLLVEDDASVRLLI